MAGRPQSLVRQIRCPATARSFASYSRSSLSLSAKNPRDACAPCQYRMQPTQTSTFAPNSLELSLSPIFNRRYASTKTPSEPSDSAETNITGAPDITNYYTIFTRTIPTGPPPASAFGISASDLRREFLQLQNLVHPDKYPAGEIKQHAEALSARINEAYRTLLDPLQRAQYLLREWHGIDVTAEDASTKHALDAETLMEVMEVQETIEEVGASPEAEGEINSLKEENKSRIEACVKSLGAAIDRGDIEMARQECVRLRFWYSVGEGLHEWQPGHTEIRLVHGH